MVRSALHRVSRWLGRRLEGYGHDMEPLSKRRRIAPVPRPEVLARYEGSWVAVVDGEVVAAAPTSHTLAVNLHELSDQKRARAVVEFVRPTSDSYIVGVG